MSIPTVIQINATAPLQRIALSETEFVVVVDDFLVDPQSLIDLAQYNADRFYVPDAGYPGLNLLIDERNVELFHRYLRRRMGPVFGFLRGGASFATGLSMVTHKPEQLGNFQRLCHTDPRDAAGRRKFAALVYLFDDERLGGTAFYRWRKPDVIEQALTLEMTDPVATTRLLAQHCADFTRPAGYMTESNELAEQLAVIPPRFNRLICYSGEIPHTGHIASPERLSTDFRRGRLTLNCFASVVPT